MNKKVLFNQEEALSKMRDRLRDLRKKAHYTQSMMGSLLGVSAQTVSGYENGTIVPGVEVLLSYCNIFNKDCNYLLHGIEESMDSDKVSLRQEEKRMVLAFRHCPEWKKKSLLSLAMDDDMSQWISGLR